ncbi:MAG: diacylglycerol/lipid kinase family protein, partial [Fidelibacterota bacterium]
NDKFNSLTGPALWLKRLSVDGAAVYSGLKAIRESLPSEVSLTLDGETIPVTSFSNLTVFKTRFFGGGMGYGRSPEQDDGRLGVAWIEASSRWRLLRLIPTLYTGTVLDYPEAHYAEVKTLCITTEAPMVIEADGQIVGTTPASYTVIPKALKVIV